MTPNTLTATEVNFAPGDSAIGDADSTCTGTTEAPTAPAGKVCLYAASVTNLSTIRGFAMSSNYGSRRAFRVNVTAPAANADIFAGGTWAYTAP